MTTSFYILSDLTFIKSSYSREGPGLLLLWLPRWKKMRGEAKVMFPQAYCISLPCDTMLWKCIVFTHMLFQVRVSFCLRWMAKSSNVSTRSFAWSLVNPLLTPLKRFERLLQNILNAGQRFLNGIQVSVEDDKCSGWPNTSKMIETFEKIRELIHENHRQTIH
jgi:hypothetical protein